MQTTIKILQTSQQAAAKGEISSDKFNEIISSAKAAADKAVAENPDSSYVFSEAANVVAQAAYGEEKTAGKDPARRKAFQEDRAKALSYADKAVERAIAQKNLEALLLGYYTRGFIAYQAHDYRSANADGAAILRLDPKNKLGRALYELSLHESQVAGDSIAGKKAPAPPEPSVAAGRPATLEEWVTRQNENATETGRLVDKSRQSLKTGALDSALSFAEAAVRSDPGDPMAYAQSGLVHEKIGDKDAVITDMTRVIALGWRWRPAYALRAKALYDSKRYRAALSDAEVIVKLDPKEAGGYFTRSLAKLGLGDFAGSLEDFAQAARLEPAAYAGDYEKARKRDQTFQADLAAWARQAASAAKVPSGAAAASGKTETDTARNPGGAASKNSALLSGPLAVGLGAGGTLLLGLALFGLSALVKKKEPQTATAEPSAVRAAGRAPAEPTASAVELSAAARDKRRIGGRYQALKLIGKGGMGNVYEGKDDNLDGRGVAIKEPSGLFASVPKFFDTIEKEAKTLMALGAHVNIVQFYDLVREAQGTRLFLIMELVRGRTLEAAISESPAKRLSIAEAVRIAGQACSALEFVHRKGVTHRDLKPSNIMLAHEDGLVKVMDFGIASVAKEAYLKTTGTVCGTWVYAAPEQMVGKACAQSDLYALAVTLYEMLTGRLPFDGPAQLDIKLARRYPPATELLPALPRSIDDFFRKGLEPDAAQRFQNAAELIAAFRQAANDASTQQGLMR